MPEPFPIRFAERPYRTDDFEALAHIEDLAGDASWGRCELAFFTESLTVDTRVVTPFGYPAEAIGFYVVEHGDDVLYLSNLAVRPDWRRKGVAAFALEAATALARSLNYRELALDVQERNLAAQLLYRKAGFRAIDIRREFYSDQDGYHMVKSLLASPAAASLVSTGG